MTGEGLEVAGRAGLDERWFGGAAASAGELGDRGGVAALVVGGAQGRVVQLRGGVEAGEVGGELGEGGDRDRLEPGGGDQPREAGSPTGSRLVCTAPVGRRPQTAFVSKYLQDKRSDEASIVLVEQLTGGPSL